MTGFPKEMRLRDGEPIQLRLLEPGDLDELHDFLCDLPAEDRLYLKEDVTDRSVVEAWTREFDPDHVLAILARLRGHIVGYATLRVERVGWSRHMGEICCVVAREHQRRGIGTVLAHELLARAVARGLRRIKAQMMREHVGAIRAFSKLGFTQDMVLRGHAVDLQGEEHDLVVMMTDTEALWRRLEDQMMAMDLSVHR